MLLEAWKGGIPVDAEYTAIAASLGWISTRIAGDLFGREWQITAKGRAALKEIYGIDTSKEDDDAQA